MMLQSFIVQFLVGDAVSMESRTMLNLYSNITSVKEKQPDMGKITNVLVILKFKIRSFKKSDLED